MFYVVNKYNPEDVRAVYHVKIMGGACRHLSFVTYDKEQDDWGTISSADYRPYTFTSYCPPIIGMDMSKE